MALVACITAFFSLLSALRSDSQRPLQTKRSPFFHVRSYYTLTRIPFAQMFKINSFSKAALSTKPPLSTSQPTYVVVVEGLASFSQKEDFQDCHKKDMPRKRRGTFNRAIRCVLLLMPNTFVHTKVNSNYYRLFQLKIIKS